MRELTRTAQPQDEVVAILQNGDRLEGVFIRQDETTVVIRISGVNLSIDRSSIERLVVMEPPADRYKRMRSMIEDDDVERLLMLAEWLQRRRMYKEALTEIETALKAEPNSGDALRQKKLISELAALAERAQPGSPESETQRREASEVAKRFPARPKANEFPLLTPEQVNLMKVFEVDLRDPPKMVIPHQVVTRLMTQYADDPLIPGSREAREAFARKPPAEILDVMFRLRAREFYESVQVLDQPRSMKLFRDNIHAAWLVTGCASTACHGGMDSGRLLLYNYRLTAEQSVYTNFLILDRFVTREGKRLIDYDEPERSLLLQMGLPRDDARTPHPRIPGWSPVFRNRDARRYLQAIEWIRSMYRPRPDYPIEYDPPGTRVPAAPDGESLPPGPKEPVER